MRTNPIRSERFRHVCRLFLLAILPWATGLCASDAAKPAPDESERIIAAVRAADDERVAATKAADRARLEAILSDALRYGHATARIDTKTSFVEAITTHRSVFESYEYLERKFSPVAPGIVVMSGHALLRVRNAQGANDADLVFLAVWREEHGQWRFLAWQSCKVPPPASAAK